MSPIVRSGVSEKGLRTTPFSSRNTLGGRSLGRGWRWPMGASRASVAGGGGLAWLTAGGLWAEVAAFSANATLRKTELSTATHMTAWSAKVGFIFASSIGSVDAALMHDPTENRLSWIAAIVHILLKPTDAALNTVCVAQPI
jgi:hypothetical protein